MNSELVLGGDYYVGDLVVGQEQRVGTIKIGSTTYNRYVKIVDFGAMPNNTVKTVAHGITGITKGEQLLSIKGRAGSTGNSAWPIPYTSNTNNEAIAITVNSNNISITTYSNWTNVNAYVTLEYYK